MSDTNTTEDRVDIPEGDPENFSEQRVKRRLSPGLKLGILMGGVFVILAGSFLMSGSSTTETESAMRGAPALDATPGGVNQTENPRFQEILQQANDQRAREALDRGQTFIPVPEGTLEPLERFDRADAGRNDQVAEPAQPPRLAPEPAPRPEPRLIEQRAIPAPSGTVDRPRIETTSGQQQQNPYLQGMIQQMGSVTRGISETGIMEVNDQQIEDENAVTADLSDPGGAGQDTPAENQIIAAGAILYAETLTSSSSDLPGPVLVEVTTGPLKGSRLVGQFTTVPSVDRMVIEFGSMTLPDGTSVSVSAFAVDGVSAETAVASDVNRRYIRRYAPILAASFITGYATAVAQPSQQVVELGEGNSLVSAPSTERQSLYAGLAAASQAIGGDLIQNAPKGPEVILRSGWPVGIMFVEPVNR